MILTKFVPGYRVFDPAFGFLFNSYYNTIGDRTPRDHRGDLSRPTVKRVFEYRKYVDEQMLKLLSEPSAVADGLTQPSSARSNVQPPATAGGSDLGDLSEPCAVADGLTRPSNARSNVQPPATAGGSDLGVLSEPSAVADGLTRPSSAKSNVQPPATAGGSDFAAPAGGFDIVDLVVLGINHEQQHQELLITDLKFTFSVNPLRPAYREGFAPEEQTEAAADGMHQIAGGMFDIGFAGGGFCFDNELARHQVYLDDFEISRRLVTNAEFIEFVEDGGYGDHRLWHSEGWDWVKANDIEGPLYWEQREGERRQFTLGGLRPLVPNAPVCHISFYEAAAFAEWKGMRLPTEFEWEASTSHFDWGLRWEWTNSAYLAYPGFQKGSGAVGEYNGKFMINQMVLRGASVATPAGHSRPTYRNFFQPHLRWQFTGLRLAR
jgi:formylglycine-generating enzyme required for sulfatase activity